MRFGLFAALKVLKQIDTKEKRSTNKKSPRRGGSDGDTYISQRGVTCILSAQAEKKLTVT
ncbi:hypothetical protein GCM10007362_40930 [Saccharibacillus endophyticus]|uniref:Uncharacterized protein n=1 Tax=Saccharibacillus endophyticus TaxID=2060666 RepID=A0ABQ2A4X4_9BACL|nr:hypothetical protein GCM10007362_40930 [Saccharibacillus endophyticus]